MEALSLAGLQKMTLLDYPGKIACTVFLGGCDFRCPFCHNAGLLTLPVENALPVPDFLAWLGRRRGKLDGVCLSGGEPTLSPGLPDLARSIKKQGFLLKLDTNGAHPSVVDSLLGEGLLDYIAMDIKNSPDRYEETAGRPVDIRAVDRTIRLIMAYKEEVPAFHYEFRTTVVEELHDEASFRAICTWIQGAESYYLQPYRDSGQVLQPGWTTPSLEELTRYQKIMEAGVKKVEIRGLS